MDNDQIVTPTRAVAAKKFNYNSLIEQFGLNLISTDLIKRLEEVIGHKAHYLLRREIFFAHQDFDKIIEAKAAGKEVYIYTGRGPSAEALHLGHLISMMLSVWLQKIFDCWVVIEMSDEEKYYFKDGTLEDYMSYTESNAKDIIACGFNPSKTFIFSSLKYEHYMRPIIAKINKKMSVHTTNKIYGFGEEVNIGQVSWASYQMAPAYCGAFPHIFGDRRDVMCIIPMAVDQTPYFRAARDFSESLGYPKPAMICSKFLVGLQGINEKASTTGDIPPIFLCDTYQMITDKIKKYAFSGGGATLKEHRTHGGNLAVDIPYIYLYHFLDNDDELHYIEETYSTGKMLTSEIKRRLIDELIRILDNHRVTKSMITTDIYNNYFSINVQQNAAEYFLKYYDRYLNISVKYILECKNQMEVTN